MITAGSRNLAALDSIRFEAAVPAIVGIGNDTDGIYIYVNYNPDLR